MKILNKDSVPVNEKKKNHKKEVSVSKVRIYIERKDVGENSFQCHRFTYKYDLMTTGWGRSKSMGMDGMEGRRTN